MEKSLFIFTDGGARGNPGPAAIGVVIKDQDHKVIGQISQTIGHATNNVAEYKAVIAGLRWIIERHKGTKAQRCRGAEGTEVWSCRVNFFLDSTLVVNQLSGKFKIKNADLKKLALEAKALEKSFGGPVSYTAIPREKNREADFLVNQALDGVPIN
ncbi:MAG: ribonuclease HI family protein [bacterium]|nr:ribonuclease HI family protein [bacterium]